VTGNRRYEEGYSLPVGGNPRPPVEQPIDWAAPLNLESVRQKARRRAANQRTRLRHHGLTHAEYDVMFAQQGGKCAVCQIADAVVIDHDHSTNTVRGLLCQSCNTGLGIIERPGFVAAAQAYLARCNASLRGSA
jgi:hypothetical protein